jgi:hypothetical protein
MSSRRQRWRLAQSSRSVEEEYERRRGVGQHGWSVCCARWEVGAVRAWCSPIASGDALTSVRYRSARSASARARLSAMPRAFTAGFACAGARRGRSSFGDCPGWRGVVGGDGAVGDLLRIDRVHRR